MRKTKRNFNNTTKASRAIPKFDFTFKGFAIDHEDKTIYVLEHTDCAIRNGDEELLHQFFDILAKHPGYSGAVLHLVLVA